MRDICVQAFHDSDKGHYTCVSENKYGSVSYDFTVQLYREFYPTVSIAIAEMNNCYQTRIYILLLIMELFSDIPLLEYLAIRCKWFCFDVISWSTMILFAAGDFVF